MKHFEYLLFSIDTIDKNATGPFLFYKTRSQKCLHTMSLKRTLTFYKFPRQNMFMLQEG